MMTTITCTFCGKDIELSEALTKDIEKTVLETEYKKHRIEVEQIKREAEVNTQKLVEQEKLKAEVTASSKMALQLKQFQDEAAVEKKDNKELREQLGALMQELRELKKANANAELEMQKKLNEEEGKIRDEATKQADEKQRLNLAAKEKTISDLQKALHEAQRKAAQGSQQTQGEVLELELERLLKAEFPLDDIVEVKKGMRGADVKQNIFNANGQHCGAILWETKNGQWQNPWPGKLREDQRQAKADMAVLVCENLPEDIDNFVFRNNVWITSHRSVIGLAYALRHNIIQLHMTKLAGKGKDEKMETLFNYLIGSEFRHRIEAIVESFTGLQDEIEREKRTSQAKWTRQEKEVRRVIDQTIGLYGDLQGITGRALQKIQTLELPEPKETEE